MKGRGERGSPGCPRRARQTQTAANRRHHDNANQNATTPNNKQLILAKAQPKRLGGFEVTGPVLAALTEQYAAAINAGAAPAVATAWQGASEAECRRAADEAAAAYAAAFDAGAPVAAAVAAGDEAALEKAHARALAAARAAFAATAIGDRALRRAHEARALEACCARFEAARARARAEAAARVNEALLEGGAALAAAARGGGGGGEGDEDGGTFDPKAVEAAVSARQGGFKRSLQRHPMLLRSLIPPAISPNPPFPGLLAPSTPSNPNPIQTQSNPAGTQLSSFLDRYASAARGATKWPKLLAFVKAAVPGLLYAAAAAEEERVRAGLLPSSAWGLPPAAVASCLACSVQHLCLPKSVRCHSICPN